MRTKFMISALIAFLCTVSFTHAALTEEAKIESAELNHAACVKVLLSKDIDGALIEAKGSYSVKDPLDGKKISSGVKGKRFYLYPHKEGIKWGEDFIGTYQIKLLPNSKKTSFLVNGRQYQGSLEIYCIDDKITIINEVDIENYLQSALAPRFASHIHSTVMDALAIVERTNTYYQVIHNKDAFWHVNAQEVDYRGYGVTQFNHNVDRAVNSTKFLVMTYENKPFATTWNQNCAGKTASYQSIFRKNVSSPNGITSAFAQRARKENHWSFSVPRATLAKIAKTNRITGLELYIDSGSEKVYALRVQDGNHQKEIDFFHLQKALQKSNLLSNDFTASIQGDSIIFDGFGEGCSVGLCIYSATQMANRGDSAPEILGTFYPYSHIEQIKNLPSKDLTKTISVPKTVNEIEDRTVHGE